MKQRINLVELKVTANKYGFYIQHECGGYRLVEMQSGGRTDIYPKGGICRVVPARELDIFLQGFLCGYGKGLKR